MKANRDNFPAREAFQQALAQHALGHLSEAIALMRQSVLLFADMDSPKTTYLFLPTLREERALACETCADYLMEAEQAPEAVNLYQEAINVCHSIPLPTKAEECARKSVAAINSLRFRPEERLQLLIARHERQRQQLALQKETEEEQARILMEIGRICVRRERYPQAKESYEEALRLLLMVEEPSLALLHAKGVCHHQLGNLALYRFQDLHGAEAHYRMALADMEACGEFEERDPAAEDMCRYGLEDAQTRLADISRAPSRREERE